MLSQILHRKGPSQLFIKTIDVAKIDTHEKKSISSESTYASTDIQKARETDRQADRAMHD